MQKEFVIAIVGGRYFQNYEHVKKVMLYLLDKYKDRVDGKQIKINSGCAKGADSLGERFAIEYGYEINKYPALWNDLTAKPCKIGVHPNGIEYNTLAGLNRNTDVVRSADMVVAFHNKKSKGTADAIKKAKALNKHLIEVNVEY